MDDESKKTDAAELPPSDPPKADDVHLDPDAPKVERPEGFSDPRGQVFDAKIHAQHDDGSPKRDSFGHFILRELDYVPARFSHFADTFRHEKE